MGFFEVEGQHSASLAKAIKGVSIDMLRKRGCEVCPLNLQTTLCHPHMKAAGADTPDVYMLGAFPTLRDDKRGHHFSGDVGDVLRMRIPMSWDARLRWNYIVRTAPPKGRAPTPVEVECCRKSIVADIEAAKPVAIFGFGSLVLEWISGERRIDAWTGRRMPVMVGEHRCWFFPMHSPHEVLESRRFQPRNSDAYGSDLEFKFALDMKNALRSIAKLPPPIVHVRDDALHHVEIVTGRAKGDLDRVVNFLLQCHEQKIVGLDYETQGLRPYPRGNKLLTAAIATATRALAFPFYHKDAGWSSRQLKVLNEAWTVFLTTSKCRKVSHNLAFEQEWSAYTFGVDTIDVNTWDDSMSQAYLLDERQNTTSLESRSLEYFGLALKGLFTFDKQNMQNERLEDVLFYNGADAKYHRKVFVMQRAELRAQGMLPVYRHQVQRVNASVMTTLKGLKVCARVVEENYEKYSKECDEVERELRAFPEVKKYERQKGHPFKPSNANHVTEVLTKYIGARLERTVNKKDKKKKSKNYSTTQENMGKVKHPFAALLIKWRKASKLLSTYVLPVRAQDTIIDKKVHKTQLFRGGVLHAIINTTRTSTWRTASTDPNIQNWPKRGPSKVIRRQVECAADEVIVAIDYAGIQARNVAMESKDKGLIKHYWARYDIHGDWLGKLLKLVPDWMPPKNIGKNLSDTDLFKERRSVVKNGFVFPTFFGAAGKSIAGPRYLLIDERKAIQLSEMFLDEFSGVAAWQDNLRKSYFKQGYVTGLSGFRRHAPVELNQLINAPIQADETIIVCGAWARLCQLGDDRLVPNLMVHDDLSFVWKRREMDKLLEQVIPTMLEQVHEWERIVPMEIEVSMGTNWCDLKEIGKFETLKGGGYHEVK